MDIEVEVGGETLEPQAPQIPTVFRQWVGHDFVDSEATGDSVKPSQDHRCDPSPSDVRSSVDMEGGSITHRLEPNRSTNAASIVESAYRTLAQ
ncbi:protein of unknown function [Cupriavidus taiwanensis]|nr:protein of unknown function [Cupriavidus taiwanensis]